MRLLHADTQPLSLYTPVQSVSNLPPQCSCMSLHAVGHLWKLQDVLFILKHALAESQACEKKQGMTFSNFANKGIVLDNAQILCLWRVRGVLSAKCIGVNTQLHMVSGRSRLWRCVVFAGTHKNHIKGCGCWGAVSLSRGIYHGRQAWNSRAQQWMNARACSSFFSVLEYKSNPHVCVSQPPFSCYSVNLLFWRWYNTHCKGLTINYIWSSSQVSVWFRAVSMGVSKQINFRGIKVLEATSHSLRPTGTDATPLLLELSAVDRRDSDRHRGHTHFNDTDRHRGHTPLCSLLWSSSFNC